MQIKDLKDLIIKLTIINANIQLGFNLIESDYMLTCIPTQNNSVRSFLVYSKSKVDNHQFYLHLTYGTSEGIGIFKQHDSVKRSTEFTTDLILPQSSYPVSLLDQLCLKTKPRFLQTENGVDILTNNHSPINA